MPILQRVRKLLRRRPGPLAVEDAQVEPAPGDSAQAPYEVGAVPAVEPDPVAGAASAEGLDGVAESDLEIEPASHILADTSHYARLEPKSPSSDEVVSPQEFSRTTDLLTDGMSQLRAHLTHQAGRLDALAQSIARLADALDVDRRPDARVDQLQQAVASMLARQGEMTSALEAIRSQASEWEQQVRSGFDAAGQGLDGLTTRVINVQKQQLAHAEQLKAQEGAVQQVGQRLLSVEHTQRGAIGSLEQAIDRMARETAALERRTSTLRGLLVLAAVASTTAALLGLIALIGG